MPNPYFRFKKFTVYHDRSAMKVATDACLFGAWCAQQVQKQSGGCRNLLDIGTGTGLLSLMIAQKNEIEIDAVEIEKQSALQAQENINNSPWAHKIRIFNRDINTFDNQSKYDLIISNPPFYEKEIVSSVPEKNIAHHSSQLNFQQLFSIIFEKLSEEGSFYLLIPFKRYSEVRSILKKMNLFEVFTVVVKQSFNHEPFRVMFEGSKQDPHTHQTSTMAIWNENQEYTSEFSELLKDYYLYL